MNYKSTRNSKIMASAAEVIVKGLSDDGGLFVPFDLPGIDSETILSMKDMTYIERAFIILKLFLTDFTDEEIKFAVKNAYSKNFENDNVAELSNLIPNTYMLELWHGPTCAFKDMALQILPYLMKIAVKKVITNKEIAILVATSGDTGKAALEGFKDVDGTKIIVFYPENGVSDMQKRQMTTQEGKNVSVCAVKGNFDDCQNGVKEIFTNEKIKQALLEKNILLSSANSINWGRLLPQIVYYFSAYAELYKNKGIEFGEEINVVVPTGNFGNILAAYYAKKIGLPIKKLICASNSNNILTDFINTGIYDKNRKFHTTISPSMDILISSNLERLLYSLSGENDVLINEWFDELKTKGRYEVNREVKIILKDLFFGGYCSDTETKETIKKVFDEYSYLMDTHTAVAYKVYDDYKDRTGDLTKTIIVSTANPYKFVSSVYSALNGDSGDKEEFKIARILNKNTGTKIPEPLVETESKEIRFKELIDRKDMIKTVSKFLELDG